MSDSMPAPHPADFVALCENTIARLGDLARAGPLERGALLPPIHRALAEIHERLAELDWATEAYTREQAAVQDAAATLAAIDLDRGGPHVPRYVERIIGDLRRIATG